MSDDMVNEGPTSDEKARHQADQEKRVRSEATKLRRMLRQGGIDEERLKGVARLIASAAFLAVTLSDLEDEINLDGCTDTYQNGALQWGTKQSPAVQTHATFLARHLTTMKQLVDLLPEGEPKKPKDPLLDYVNRQ